MVFNRTLVLGVADLNRSAKDMRSLSSLFGIAAFLTGAVVGCAREQSATIYFKTVTTHAYEQLNPRKNEIKADLLKDDRLVDAKTLDPLWDQRPKMNGWMLYGTKEKAFEGTSIVLSPQIDNTKPVPASVWIWINCRAREIDSDKIKSLKALITATIGEKLMAEIEITVIYENMFNTRP